MAGSYQKTDSFLDPRALGKVKGLIQTKIDSGYPAPCGWLFRGFTFYFVSRAHQGNREEDAKPEAQIPRSDDQQLLLVSNTARFAGADISTSLRDPKVTHVILNPEAMSPEEISSLRKFLATRTEKRLPHLVSFDWIEESWRNRTLVDEESRLHPPL